MIARRVAFVGFLLACGPSGPTPSPSPSAGASADFSWAYRTPLGNVARLEELRGRVIFINVWATWCPPCVAELTSIARLADSLAGTDVVILPVSPEEVEPVRAFLRRRQLALPALTEVTPMPPSYDLRAVPTTWIIDRQGRIVLRHQGAARWDAAPMVEFLRQLASAP